MRWRVILGFSLVANLILAIAWWRTGRPTPSGDMGSSGATNSITSTNVRTAVIVRRQFFSWRELESRDYPTYIKNLREIGCPEQTIRDIIIADVTAMLREKHQEQSPRLKPNPKWWTNHRDAAADDVESRLMNAMWTERSAILEQLLGADWAVRNYTPPQQTNTYQNVILATLEVNPVLQGLTAEKKQAIAAILGLQLESPEGTAGFAKAVADEKARWAKVAEVLSIEQLEAAKLHFSSHADDLRGELDSLPGFDTQPEEFRKIFRATEAIDEQLYALGERDDAEAQQRREKLLAERDAAIRATLVPARFEQFARLRDPAYLSALETLANGGNPATLGVLYAINREATAEQERIENDATLSETQREIELKKLELEQLKATAQALGESILEDAAQPEAQTRPEPRKIHSVAGGESLERIARIYGVDPSALRSANPGVNFDKLQPGVNVNVPLRLIYPLPPPD
jgi:hypothetical protein